MRGRLSISLPGLALALVLVLTLTAEAQSAPTNGVSNADGGNDIGLYTNAVERMHIDSSGNVGIGTASLASTFAVNGSTAFLFGSDYTTTGAQADVNLGTASTVRYNGGAAATFYGIVAGGSGQLLYLHNASSYTLTLSNQSSSESTAANKIITGTGADLTLSSNSSVVLQYDGTASRWRIVGGTGSGGTANTMIANWPDAIECTGTSGNVELFNTYVSPSGARTYSASFAGAYVSTIYNSNGTYSTEANSGFVGYFENCESESISQLYAAGQAFNFVNGASASQWTTSGSNIWYNAGNVGIGTTGPTHGTLDIASSSADGPNIFLNNLSGTSRRAELDFGASGGTYFSLIADRSQANTTSFDIYGNAAGSSAIHIDNNNNVGIGTTSPAAALHVYPPAATYSTAFKISNSNSNGGSCTLYVRQGCSSDVSLGAQNGVNLCMNCSTTP